MTRYIDADALIEKIKAKATEMFTVDSVYEYYMDALIDVEDIIKAQPTADVVERNRGEWIPKDKKEFISKLSAEEIFNVIDQLIGECDAVGESNADKIRLENLEKLLDVADRCLDKINYALNTDTKSEYSIRKIGRTALKWMADAAYWFDSKKERYKNIGE